MKAVNLADIFVCVVQFYMHADIMCKVSKRKYSYRKSMVLSLFIFSATYIILNYGTDTAFARIVCGIVTFSLYIFIVFGGNLLDKLKGIVLGYGILLGLDVVVSVISFSWISLTVESISSVMDLVVARNIYNVFAYLFLVLVELFNNWRKRKDTRLIITLTAGLACCQILILRNLYVLNQERIEEYILPFTVLYSGVIIMGYYITMYLLNRTLSQQEKEKELEQKAMERQYQYDYYLLARKQSEEIRDIRHDMRNQLQTMQYLIRSDREEDRQRANKMLQNVMERVQSVSDRKEGVYDKY